MTYMSYEEQLRDPRWLAKRTRIYRRDSYTCVRCSVHGITVECHHKVYLPGRMVWEYPDHLLETLCGECHQVDYEADAETRRAIPKCEECGTDIINRMAYSQSGRHYWCNVCTLRREHALTPERPEL